MPEQHQGLWPDKLWPVVHRLLAGRALPNTSRYGLGLAIVVLAAAVRDMLPLLGLPFILFIPALMLIGFVFGAGPGILSTVTSALLTNLLFIAPDHYRLSFQPHVLAAMSLFIIVSAGIVVACSALGAILLRRERELQELSQSRAALARREEFLSSVLNASADCIKVLGFDGRLISINESGQKALEISHFNEIDGCSWPETWTTGIQHASRSAIATAVAGGVGQFRAAAPMRSGVTRWWDVVVTPIAGSGAELGAGSEEKPGQLLAVSRDITEMVQAFERLGETQAQTRLMGDELQHRLKNTLTLVQAMVRQTLRNSPDLNTAQRALEFRLAAMGRAHAMLSAGGWVGCELHDVVTAALDLHSDRSGRFEITGPKAYLDSQAATSFALVLHELATNAAKYGALSTDTGAVDISWNLEPQPEQRLSRLEFVWTERGGPPVEPPTRRGFGSRLIERSLAGTLKGQAVIDFRNDGVVCRVTGIVSPTPLLVSDALTRPH